MIITLFNPLGQLEVRGVAKVANELVRHLRRAGHTVHEVTIPASLWGTSSLSRNVALNFFQQFVTPFVALATRSQLIIDPYNGYSVIGAVLLRTKYFVHDYIPFYRQKWYLRPGTLYKYFMYKLDALFCLAEIYHVSTDIDTPPYMKMKIEPQVFPSIMDPLDRSASCFFDDTIKPQIKSESPLLLSTISGWTWNKDFGGLIELLRLLEEDVVLVAFGFGEQSFSYEEFKTATGQRCEVFRVGYVDEAAISNTISRSRVFVFHSLKEGFGRPIIEAMQLEKQVITRLAPVLSLLSNEALQNTFVYDGARDFQTALNSALSKHFVKPSRIYRDGINSSIEDFLR